MAFALRCERLNVWPLSRGGLMIYRGAGGCKPWLACHREDQLAAGNGSQRVDHHLTFARLHAGLE